MRIIFLCGSLEPGRDGVGDYTVRLAKELLRQGCIISLLAFNDKYIKSEFNNTAQNEEIDFPIMRLPSNWSVSERIKKAKHWIESFNPDWISFQFVIFSFNRKGLPFWLPRQLLQIGRKKQWHIMFHELWVGMDANATKKNIIWGWLQKNLIKNLVSTLRPTLIHTQSRLYQDQLNTIGIKSGHLPLFGNIPNINPEISISDFMEVPVSSGKTIRLVLFALIHPDAPVIEFAKEVSSYSKELNVQISLTILGRSGAEIKKWENAFQSVGLSVEVLGEHSSAFISKIFNNSTLGLSTTPIILAEKSGSIAAMREHGLPVLCVSGPWKSPNKKSFHQLSGIYQYQKGNFKDVIASKKKYTGNSTVESVASELLDNFHRPN